MRLRSLLTRDAYDILLTRFLRRHFVRGFVKTYYYSGAETWQGTTWLGVPLQKAPTDLWIYQELIWELRPDFIVESGTYKGGSALYFASICDLMKHGRVITIDIAAADVRHPRLSSIVDPRGSTHPAVVEEVARQVGGGSCLVALDSTHRKAHVLDELRAYSRFVPVGGYIVVEDTSLGGHPVLPSWGDGPYDAVKEFVAGGDFRSDRSREKFMLTLHPGGFLQRVR